MQQPEAVSLINPQLLIDHVCDFCLMYAMSACDVCVVIKMYLHGKLLGD